MYNDPINKIFIRDFHIRYELCSIFITNSGIILGLLTNPFAIKSRPVFTFNEHFSLIHFEKNYLLKICLILYMYLYLLKMSSERRNIQRLVKNIVGNYCNLPLLPKALLPFFPRFVAKTSLLETVYRPCCFEKEMSWKSLFVRLS